MFVHFRIPHLLKLAATVLALSVLGYFIIDYKTFSDDQSVNIFSTDYFGYDEVFGDVSKL